MALPRKFRWRLWTASTAPRNPHEVLLHLVDENGQRVDGDIRLATEAAYRRVLRMFQKKVDEAVLADMAEDVATSVASKRSQIGALRSYTIAALKRRVLDWLRTKPKVEISIGQLAELEGAARVAEDPAFAEVETQRLLDQLKTQLTERDRLILLLMVRGRGNPADVGAALHLNYAAAAKAIQRTRSRIADILSGGRPGTGSKPLDPE
jgi:RNA polymerase sigma factor (sigma-70 family)